MLILENSFIFLNNTLSSDIQAFTVNTDIHYLEVFVLSIKVREKIHNVLNEMINLRC